MSLFSRLSEMRFPKDRLMSNVGPGSYEVPTCLDERAALFLEGRGQENSEASFSIYVDEVDTERSTRTPRGIRASTKENIMIGSSARSRSKSLGNRSEPAEEDAKIKGSDIAQQAKKNAKLQAKDRNISELLSRVETLERTDREAQKTIAGLVAENAACEKALEEQRSIAISPAALAVMVAEMVAQELEDPRQVLCLQRQQWERQAEQMRRHTEKLERKVEKNREEREKLEEDALTRAAEAEQRAAAAAQQVLEKEAEVERLLVELEASHTEATSLRDLVGILEQSSREQAEQAAAAAKALQISQLEEHRLREMLTVSQDCIEKYKEREARMGGHTNHKQKIRITLDLKQENTALRSEVEQLQQQLLRQKRRQCQAAAATTSAEVETEDEEVEYEV